MKGRSRSRDRGGRRKIGALALVAALLALGGLAWCLASPGKERQQHRVPTPERPPAATPAPREAPAARLRVEVLQSLHHDPHAFTQGLLWHDGGFWESTGLYGSSTLRRVDPSGTVERQVSLPPSLFGEGLALVARPGESAVGRLVQLTWQEHLALVWKPQTLVEVGEHRYQGEGWGLCWDGRRLVMSDGSDTLAFRDAETFEELGRVHVELDGRPLYNLNELECVGDAVYANVWMTQMIVRIDPRNGRVGAAIDASGLLTPEEAEGTDVLNGIAYRPDTGTFYITGKLWPKMFEVRFVPTG